MTGCKHHLDLQCKCRGRETNQQSIMSLTCMGGTRQLSETDNTAGRETMGSGKRLGLGRRKQLLQTCCAIRHSALSEEQTYARRQVLMALHLSKNEYYEISVTFLQSCNLGNPENKRNVLLLLKKQGIPSVQCACATSC